MELWDGVQKGDHERALELHSQLLAFWNACDLENLPACVKYAQTSSGMPETLIEDQCLKRDRKRVFGSKRRFRMLEFELIKNGIAWIVSMMPLPDIVLRQLQFQIFAIRSILY